MIATDFIKTVIRNKKHGSKSWVRAYIDGNWWHVHRDEEMPGGHVSVLTPVGREVLEVHLYNG